MIEKDEFARWLMRQARILPADQRHAFQRFIADQMPKRGKKRKIHSWHKAKAARTKRPAPIRAKRQGDLGL